jgi:subtilisin family serine protease
VGAVCAYYQWIQGTSMASPHAAGVAALIVSAHGTTDATFGGLTMSPTIVAQILKGSATDHECTEFNYARVGRHPASEYNHSCEGTAQYNNVYGDGIVDALAAVSG